ncbi:hypothetical protein P618_200161 [Holospora obtusa F1]|uniref:Uncharacterized protein n=1 Tax=Holospora obtusa F1 TaxID=1399147 RepID=W6TV38_HOLOB|nr:hypothetical protein P618_200161 [Holospora obtusa F1]
MLKDALAKEYKMTHKAFLTAVSLFSPLVTFNKVITTFLTLIALNLAYYTVPYAVFGITTI